MGKIDFGLSELPCQHMKTGRRSLGFLGELAIFANLMLLYEL